MEIYIKGIPGKTIMKGYYNDPDSTNSTILPDGCLRSHDIEYFDDSGWLFFADRIKNNIKCSGENVSAAEKDHLS